MPSLSHRAVVGLLGATRANRTFVDAERAREHIRQRSLRPSSYAPPRFLRRDVTVSVERVRGWPVYTVAPRDGSTEGGLVYVHGGGWVNEISLPHWRLVAQVAAGARTTVTVPVYPLVPFGTAEQVVPAIADLVTRSNEQHGPTCLAGDSAGGQIALSTAELLRDDGRSPIPLTVLISPVLELSLTNPGIDVVQPHDPWLGRQGTRVLIEHWRGDLPVDDPRVSPLNGDLTGLGPVLVFSGTRDICTPDTRLFVVNARAVGVDVDLHLGDGLIHVPPLLPTPEGRAARRLIVQRVRAAIWGARGPGSAARPVPAPVAQE